MIIREIEKNPEDTLVTFDWFNDYDDTKNWLIGKEGDPILISKLKEGFEKWLTSRFHNKP